MNLHLDFLMNLEAGPLFFFPNFFDISMQKDKLGLGETNVRG